MFLNQYIVVEIRMMKSFQFRIYPNRKQEVKMISTLTTCRHLYNDALAERKQQSKNIKFYKEYPIYQEFGIFTWGHGFDYINYDNQAGSLTKNKTEYQKQVYSQVLQNVLRRVKKSFNNFFEGAGYPRFQGRNRYDSFTFPQAGFKITDDGKLKLSKIGEIKIVQHRDMEGKIKTCTIKRDVDQWYVSFSCETESQQHKKTGESVGIDLGLGSLITDSKDNKIKPAQYYRQAETKLKKAQQELSRKKKGSSNRNKQRIKVAKIHRHIRYQRKNLAHKVSKKLVDSNDTIVFEDLQIQNMVKNHHLSKSIQDAGWYKLIEFTKYKAECAGKVVKLVDPKYTSQMCSGCGSIVKKSLSVRVHNCLDCGLSLDRDHNAAINILNRGIGQEMAKSTPVEMFTKTSLKQEAPCL